MKSIVRRVMSEEIDIRYVANLARVELSEEELEMFTPQLQEILAYVDQLKALDVEDIEPPAHAMPVENVFREDHPGESLERDAVLGNAPATFQTLFEVPPIIE